MYVEKYDKVFKNNVKNTFEKQILMNKSILLCMFITMGQNNKKNKTQTILVCRKQ